MRKPPPYISDADKQAIEALRMFGPQEIHISSWRMFQRLADAGKVYLSEPHGKDGKYKTVSMPRG